MKNTEAQPPEDLSEEKPLSVGEMLRVAREAKGLSVDQLVRDLRIESTYLIALEQNNFEAFSAPVFAKGYMRQFGLSRVMFREMASSGLIPGVKKASW